MPNGTRMNRGRLVDVHNQFLQEQLMEAQQSLFFARSVKEMKFLQNKIDFLKQRLKDTSVDNRTIKRLR